MSSYEDEPPREAAPVESSVPTRQEIEAANQRNDRRIEALGKRGLIFGRNPNTGENMLFQTRVNAFIEYLLGDRDAPARREFEAYLSNVYATQLDEVEKGAAAALAKSRLIIP